MKISVGVKKDAPVKYSQVEVDEGPVVGSLRITPRSNPEHPVAIFAPGYWTVLHILDHETGEENGEDIKETVEEADKRTQ